MARVVTFFNEGREFKRVVGEDDPLVCNLWMEFLKDSLKDRGLLVETVVSLDSTQPSPREWPNLRSAVEEITQMLRA